MKPSILKAHAESARHLRALDALRKSTPEIDLDVVSYHNDAVPSKDDFKKAPYDFETKAAWP